MKRTIHKLTKTQRKARNARKTWTKAERAVRVERNKKRLASLRKANAMDRFIAQAEQEIAAEEAHTHEHLHDHEAVKAEWLEEAPLTVEEQPLIEVVDTPDVGEA
jgi:hypothetical protein